MIELNHNYLQTLQMQSIRCKIFLFIVDNFSLECQWFLYSFIYAKSHSLVHHLPILLPIILVNNKTDNAIEANCLEVERINRIKLTDIALKQKLINCLIENCVTMINMSQMDSYQNLSKHLKELIVDIIPLNDDNEISLPDRYADNFRPFTKDENEFLDEMNKKEFNLMKKFEISNFNFKSTLKHQKVIVNLSVPYNDLNELIIQMIHEQYHLIWLDVIMINGLNYFNMLWTSNCSDIIINNADDEFKLFQAKPPSYIVFYDLNTAQLAHIYKEYSIDQNWSCELIDSYSRNTDLSKKNMSIDERTKSPNAKTILANQDIFYICQFRNNNSNDKVPSNRICHSIISSRFSEVYKQITRFSYHEQNYMPIRISPLVHCVNTITNKHLFYTAIFKPIDRPKSNEEDEDDLINKKDELSNPSFYFVRNGLSDIDFLKIFEELTGKGWKLCNLKAYKDFDNTTKFSIVLASPLMPGFYEGSYKLFIGLSKCELLNKLDEMRERGLYPKIVTNYGYLNREKEHVYAIFFCQF